jgi:hypothetical protein
MHRQIDRNPSSTATPSKSTAPEFAYPELTRLKRIQAKWIPVRVKKARQVKNPQPGFDSIEAE